MFQPLDLFIGQRSFDFRGSAHDERARRNLRSRRQKRACGDKALSADANRVHHYRAYANQAAALYVAAVQSNIVPNGHFIFKNGRVRARCDVYDRAVLYVRAIPYAYVVTIAAHHSIEPDGRLFAYGNVANDLRALFYESCRMNLRVLARKG